MNNDKFFSRSNLYPAIWAIVVGLIAFIGGLLWENISGPNEVVILNNNVEKDTTVTIVQFKPDQEYFENLTKMTSKSVKKEYTSNQPSNKKETIDSLTLAIVKDYQLKFDSLRLEVSETPTPEITHKITSSPSIETESNSSQLHRPLFKLPEIVEGYLGKKANSFAVISINATKLKRNDKVIINLDFFNKQTLNKITPLFIDIIERKTENRVYQIWSEQYDIKDLNNIISFSADFKPGKYILTIGFYIKDEINQKYPTKYAKKINLEII